MQNASIWIQLVSTVATVVVAVIAFTIQQDFSKQDQAIQREIAQQERDRAAVSRSVALYRDLVSSNSFRHLRSTAHSIDQHLWSLNLQEGKEANEAVRVFGNKDVVSDIQKTRHAVAELLQNIRVIYHCGQFNRAIDTGSFNKSELCDQHTISVLMGSILTEIFVSFRPIMYCDEFVSGRYYEDGKSSGYVGNYETLVKRHMDLDFKRRKIDWKVFLTSRDRQVSVEKGELSEDSHHWSILRLPEERCMHYRNASENLAPA